jgi:NHLM bacteriocin system ABC transporter ATP-binding protein
MGFLLVGQAARLSGFDPGQASCLSYGKQVPGCCIIAIAAETWYEDRRTHVAQPEDEAGMQDVLEQFTAAATPREVAGNNPLPLDDPDGVWLVTAGRLDVFALPPSRDGVAGARVHLFRVETGQLLFGVGQADVALLAVGNPGSQVQRLPRQQLQAPAPQKDGTPPVPDATARLGALLDGWVQGLTAGVVRGPHARGAAVPKRLTILEPDRETRLAAGDNAGPARGVLWVRHLHGSSHFLGKSGPTLTADGGPFPLAGPGWLTAGEEEARLTAAATDAVLADGTAWAGLDRFHQALLAVLAVNLAAGESAERSRLKHRVAAEHRLIRSTLARLAAVTRAEGPELPLEGAEDAAATEVEEDPLVGACRLVGASMGIAIQPPLGAGEKRRRSDPVSAIARASRVRVRRVLLSGDWWRQDNGPLLAFRDKDDQPVALLPASPSRYDLVDPRTQQHTPLTAANASSVQPFAYCFYRPLPSRALTALDLLRFGVAGSRRDWVLVAVLGLAGSLLGLFTPLVTGWVFDRVIPGVEKNQLLVVVLALVVTAVSSALFQAARGIAMLRVETKMEGGVQAGLWDRLLNLPAPFFRRYTAGDLTDRAMGIGTIRQMLTDVGMTSMLAAVFSLVYFGLLFYYSVRLALLACVLFVAVLLAGAWAVRRQLRYQRNVSQVRGRIAGLVLQLITGITRLRVAGAEDRALAVWGKDFGLQRQLAFRARSVANNLSAFNAAIPIISLVVLFGTVALMPVGAISLGAFLAFNVAFVQILSTALMMSSSLPYAVEIVPLYERAKPILETLPEVDEVKAIPGDLSGDIEISHVSFRYRQDGPLVLDDVSLHIRPGEFVAFVGPSGAGKSTIIRLLLGFESPTAGSIYYDREDLAGLDKQGVRRQVGVVLQDSRLLSGDIFTNITGSTLLTVEDAWEAAHLAGLDDDIAAMPMGMHTIIGEGGSTLSGGQRQRLMIARAIVSRPRILLFDEATSALDNETQAKVIRSLESLKATRIVVAHRLSTIVRADRICVLSGGHIVQQGRYQELLDQGGLFAELVRRQLA